jgi:hypothetical protein
MNRINFDLGLPNSSDLERIIEPLASYICATDRPRTVLVSALRVLFNEVEKTNRAATIHFRNFAEN